MAGPGDMMPTMPMRVAPMDAGQQNQAQLGNAVGSNPLGISQLGNATGTPAAPGAYGVAANAGTLPEALGGTAPSAQAKNTIGPGSNIGANATTGGQNINNSYSMDPSVMAKYYGR